MLNVKELAKKLKKFFTFDFTEENLKEFEKWLRDIYYVQERITDFGSQAFPREMMADYGGPIEYNRPLDKDGNKIWNEDPYVWLRWPIDEPDRGFKNNYEGMVFANGWSINHLVGLGILEKDPDKGRRDIDYDHQGGGSKIRLTDYGKRFIEPALQELEFIFLR